MRVLELYSGIGGMHFALQSSGVDGEVVASIDINPVANSVYKHNFPKVMLLNRNIQSLNFKFINKLNVDTILMSPPCQPFTRNGCQGDISDERTKSFIHILNILPELQIKKILIENVKGFEISDMRDLLVSTLEKCNFVYQEFILSPIQLGTPNSRHRYYCLAKKQPESFHFDITSLRTDFPELPNSKQDCHPISDILDSSESLNSYFLEDKTLKKFLNILDICYKNSKSSCCFTKAYGRYIEGTGSVYTAQSQQFVDSIFVQLSSLKTESKEYLELAKQLELRFFTPKEISRLMNFPETFTFPENLKNRQKYMLLGNSINVRVVGELIKLLN